MKWLRPKCEESAKIAYQAKALANAERSSAILKNTCQKLTMSGGGKALYHALCGHSEKIERQEPQKIEKRVELWYQHP